MICSGGTQNRKRHSLITRPRHLRASAIAISRENPHSQACDYSPHYGQWPLSSTVMLRDCQTGGENDRLGAGACRGSRRRLRHSISAVGPKIPSTEALKIARAGLFTSRQTSSHRISVQAIFFRRRHQPRRPALAKINPGRPAPAIGPGTVAEFSRTLSRPYCLLFRSVHLHAWHYHPAAPVRPRRPHEW